MPLPLQFYRSFPYPPGISEQDVQLLAKRYLDPTKDGICNYLNFHNDVERAKGGLEEKLFEGKPPATYNIPKEVNYQLILQPLNQVVIILLLLLLLLQLLLRLLHLPFPLLLLLIQLLLHLLCVLLQLTRNYHCMSKLNYNKH